MEVDCETADENAVEYRRGFEDCLDLVEDVSGSSQTLDKLKEALLTIRISIKEKKVEKIREDLGI